MDISNISLSKAVLLFYIISAGNYTGGLVSKQLQEFLKSNRYAQHMIGYITMLVLTVMAGGVTEYSSALFYALAAYVWFIFTTKLDAEWNIIIIIMLVAGFLYESKAKEKEIASLKDKNLSEEHIMEIRAIHNRNKLIYVGIGMVLTIIGTIFYTNKQKIQHGGGFDLIKYVFE